MTAAVSVAEPCVLSCSGLGFAVRDAQLLDDVHLAIHRGEMKRRSTAITSTIIARKSTLI